MIGFANEISSVLYPKHDYVKETGCAALANIVKIGSSILLTLPSVIVPFMAAPAALTGGVANAEIAGVAETSVTRVSTMSRLNNMVRRVGNSVRPGRAFRKYPPRFVQELSSKDRDYRQELVSGWGKLSLVVVRAGCKQIKS